MFNNVFIMTPRGRASTKTDVVPNNELSFFGRFSCRIRLPV